MSEKLKDLSTSSPYKNIDDCSSYRGTWHVHMHSSHPTPDEARGICRQGGYDFLGVTDHDNRYLDLPWDDQDWEQVDDEDFVFLLGFEATHPIGHITCLGAMPEEVGVDPEAAYKNRFEDADLEGGYGTFLAKASQRGAFISLNHPAGWRGKSGELVQTKDFENIHALEIYNGNQFKNGVERGYVVELLDDCLEGGYQLWTAACPDCHKWDEEQPDSPFNGYSVVYARDLSRESLLSALKAGRFYTTNGLEVDEIRVTDTRIEVASEVCSKISFIGRGGEVLSEVQGPRASYRFQGDEGYVRTELTAAGLLDRPPVDFPLMAWLQPVWIGGSR